MPAAELPDFRGAHEVVYILPGEWLPGQPMHVHVEAVGSGSEELRMTASTLDGTLARGEEHARMIALTFGALMAMALSGLMI